MALDVEARIGLGITKPLRFLQTIGKVPPILLHAGENVIAGAVEDAVDARECGAVEPLAQRLDDRNPAGDRRFEIERHTMAFGELGCAGGSADDLNEHVDFSIACQRRRIADPAKFAGIKAAFFAARSCANGDDFDIATTARNQLVAAAFQQLHDGTADRAESGKTDFERLSHSASPGLDAKMTRPGES